jgi:hypothetical protein
MIGEQEAGRARTLRGEAETARRERGLDLDSGKRCDQRAALQTFFESPGRVGFIPDHHDKKKSGVEAVSDEPRSVRAAPFPCGMPGQAPQDEVAGRVPRRRLLGDDGKGESKRGRLIAVTLGLDLMYPAFFEFAQKGDGARHARMQASLRSGHPCQWQRARRGAPGVDCRVMPGNDEGGRKRAGGVGRGRARCGGIGQGHGNLLERADLRA